MITSASAPERDDRSLYGAEYVWKRNGPDHYVHAFLYAAVGLQRYGGDMAKILDTNVLGNIPHGQIVKPQGVATFVEAGEFTNPDQIFNG